METGSIPVRVIMAGRRLYEGRSDDTLVRHKNCELFMKIVGVNSVQRASREVDVTYSHAVGLLVEWCHMGLLVKSKDGRRNRFVYTVKGEQVRRALLELQVLRG